MKLRFLLRPTLSVSLGLLAAVAVRAEVLERVVARVNGDIVTLSEFEARQMAAVQAARVTEDQVEPFLRQNNERILQEAIDDLLLAQRGEELGIKPRPEYIQEFVDNIKKENHLTSDEEFQAQLRREGMTLGDLKRSIERSVIRRQVLAHEIEQKAAASDAEVRGYYDTHKAEFERNDTVKLQEIVAGSAAAARELVRRARAGEDFAALARQNSTGSTKASGGDLGRLSRGDLAPALEKVAFSLPVGGISDPVEVGGAWRVLRVAEKTAAGVVPFEEARPLIQQRLTGDRADSQYKQYVEGLRKNALIAVTVREVPLQVGTAPAAQRPAPPPAAPVDPSAEIVTTPQAAPIYVPPPALVPVPVPTPSPLAPSARPSARPPAVPATGERP
jgi:peptidyl-prolyl cis-trans isomerase SurA